MSVSFLRQARLSRSLTRSCRVPSSSACRHYATGAAQPRHDPPPNPPSDPATLAGPSSPDPVSAADPQRVLEPSPAQDEDRLEPFNRVRTYLASIHTAGNKPTLEDLDRYRPSERPSLHSPAYAEAYNELIGTLDRSFTKEQLRGFLVASLGTSRHCKVRRRKVEYAESILDQIWQWPSLSDLAKAKRDNTEVITKMFPTTASELFLLMGTDGTDLLRMSQEYDVRISLHTKPLGLRVEGTRSALRELSERIVSLKSAFVEDTFLLPVPTPIPAEMVQRISRLALAYIENVDSPPGKIRICARDGQGIETAKRLASRAVHEEGLDTPWMAYLPPHVTESSAASPSAYALYPHLSPRPLPFTMNASGTSRLRRVGEWLSVGFQDDIEHSGRLAEGLILSEANNAVPLRETLLQSLSDGPAAANATVKASLGHILLTQASQEQRPPLVPPLSGEHTFGKIRKWISNDSVKLTFVPDIPLPLLSTPPSPQKVLHRLVYHSLSASHETRGQSRGGNSTIPLVIPRKVITLEVELAGPQSSNPRGYSDPLKASKLLERIFDKPGIGETTDSADEPPADLGEGVSPSSPISSNARYTSGIQVEVNLLMPDRAMDLQFVAARSAEMPVSQCPHPLTQYADDLHAYLSGLDTHPDQPSPPMLVVHEGERYLLYSNTTMRLSDERVAPRHQTTDRDSTRALCGSALDLESNQKSMHCEVACDDITRDDSWTRFLSDCDNLSNLALRPSVSAFDVDERQDE